MQRSEPQASARAWGWLAALLDGATTPWSQWVGEAEPRLPFYPAAQQLEALRRVNVAAAAAGHPVPRGARDLLTNGVTDRNRGDLVLAGEHAPPFGPPAVDPAGLAPRDLLQVLAGPLARSLAAIPRARPRRQLWSGPELVGDPWATTYLRAEQVRRRRARPAHRAVVLGGDLATLAVHQWAHQTVTGGVLGMRVWLHRRIRPEGLPRSLDLAGLARRVAADLGRRRTVIAIDTGAVHRLGAPPALDPVAVDLARWVGRPLGVLVPARRRRELLMEHLIPAATRVTAPLVLPEPLLGLLTEHAERQRSALRTAGYPVLGSLDGLLPSTGTPTVFPSDRAVLARALDLMIDPWEEVSR